MSVIKEFIEATDIMNKVHKAKNDDYAFDANPMFNFDVQEYVMGLFNDPRDKVFTSLIGLKLARLANLLNKVNGQINNESIEDTFIDMANYTLLWRADRIRRKVHKPTDQSVGLKVDQIKSR